MDIQALTPFFKWCTIINGGLLVLWATLYSLVPDLLYRTQHTWFPAERETFNAFFYGYLGLFKIFFLMFNLTPYLALLIVGSQ